MSRSGLDRLTTVALAKLVTFLIVTGLLTAMLAVLIGNVTFGRTREYRAVFTDATSLVRGDDVRIAGVRVGNVSDIAVGKGATAVVTFKVESDVQLTGSTQAAVRYRNMIGQRYVSLSQGTSGSAARLPEGGTIGLEQTQPALDLTELFAGFQPLFVALNPEDTNQLAYELIQVFQGEGGTVESLLTHTASLTQTLADRNELIDSVITNLTTVLQSFNDRDTELSTAVSTLQQLITGLKNDRGVLTGSLDDIAAITGDTAELLSEVRPPLDRDIAHLKDLTADLGTKKSLTQLDNSLKILPIKIDRLGRAGEYGAFFNLFICDAGVDGQVPSLSGVSGWQDTAPFRTTTRVTATGPGVNRCR